jgi:FG-GAP-like repeat
MMARGTDPPQTDVAKQIRIGLKLAALALGVIALLWMCVRGPIHRWTLDHPQFDASPPQPLPHSVGVIAAGHIDHDEFIDLIAAATQSNPPHLMIFPGTAEGPDLAHPVHLPDSFAPLDLAVGDLDGDGREDIVLTSQSEYARGVVVLWNSGGFHFEAETVVVPLRLVDILDENRDGQPDLVGVTRERDAIWVHRISGRTIDTEAAVIEDLFDSSVQDMEAAHLDRGGMDIALVSFSRSSRRIRILRAGGMIPDPTSYFNLPPMMLPADRPSTQTASLIFDDLNGDERPDIAFIDLETIQVHLGLGGADLIPLRHAVASQPVERVISGDFTGDGNVDLLAVGTDGLTIQLLRGVP